MQMGGDNGVVIDLSEDEENLNAPQVSKWSSQDVSNWLGKIGYGEYKTCVTNSLEPINGERLLQLTSDDLQRSPFFIEDRSECEHLQSFIEKLRGTELSQQIKTLDRKEITRPYYLNKNQSQSNGRILNGFPPGSRDENQDFANIRTPLISGDDILPTHNSHHELYPAEKMKTLVALAYLFTGFVVSVLTLQFVHERVPPMEEEPPLPDVFFDIVPVRFEKAFNACEFIGLFLAGLATAVALFHRHRFIVLRRIAFIVGTLYLYRSCTMYVTTLPVPGLHFKCAPKANGQVSLMISRAFGLLIGGGLSVTGSHHLCGDYLFSGHTLILVVAYLLIYEYTPRRWWYVHWVCWMLSCAGIICILLAHDHYTVDVVVAYILTSRLFYTYHTMCNNPALKDGGNSNLLARCWWFPIFQYFEGNVRSNGPLPRQYEWPFPWPKPRHTKTTRRSPVKGV